MARRILLILATLLAAAAPAWARGGGGCFRQGTPILTPGGSVAIENLRPGDAVLAVRAGRIETAAVCACTKVTTEEFVQIDLPGLRLCVTADHPFQVAEGIFRAAGALQAGQTLWRRSGNSLIPQRVLAVGRIAADGPAYNLLVSPGGTYLAGGIAVHNKGCFLPDTPILRADASWAAIRDIRPGDTVLAFTADAHVVPARVHAVLRRQVDEYFVVATESAVLNVTAEHPLYVGGGTYKTVAALKPGDEVFAFDGCSLAPRHILSIQCVRGDATVYNLQTDEPHTFFAAGLAVHNKGGGCFPAGAMVLTSDGARAIETIRPGDRIVAVDENRRAVVAAVEEIFTARCPLLTVRTDLGTLATTADHPLLLADGVCVGWDERRLRVPPFANPFQADSFQGGTRLEQQARPSLRMAASPCFVPAGLLRPGDRVAAWRNGAEAPAVVLEIVQGASARDVYTLRVGGPHTFVADGFVVHNKGGGGFGGGGFHSSGYHGGSTSQPGSNEGWESYVPFAGILAIILLPGIIRRIFKSKKDENLDFTFRRAAIDAKAGKTKKLLDFIAKTDSSVSPHALANVATSTFLKLQECWQARQYEPMAPLLMPSLYKEHCNQLAGMVRDHEVNMIADLTVRNVDIVNIRYTNKPEQREFTALITASARDYYVDDRSKKFLRGDTSIAVFQEFWTFHRQGEAWLLREIEQTREGTALKDENFFEPFTLHQLKRLYAGGDPTAEADQAGPAGPWAEKDVLTKATKIERMLDFLVKTDKIWDRQQMEERARTVFVNVFLALQAGEDPGENPPDLMGTAAQYLRDQISEHKAAGLTVEFRNLCVRKVEIILVRNFADNAKDEFTVRIAAHAQTIVNKGGQVKQEDEFVKPFEQYWTFGRDGSQWKLKAVLSPAAGREKLKQENLDEDSSPAQVQWYYKQERAN